MKKHEDYEYIHYNVDTKFVENLDTTSVRINKNEIIEKIIVDDCKAHIEMYEESFVNKIDYALRTDVLMRYISIVIGTVCKLFKKKKFKDDNELEQYIVNIVNNLGNKELDD